MASCPGDDRANGGPGSIAEQLVEHRVDVLLGGGRQRFRQAIRGGPNAGRSVVDVAAALGYRVVDDGAGLEETEAGEKVLGLFSDGNMDVEWSGAPAAPYPGSGPQRCAASSRRAVSQPRLADMTTKALDLLARDDDGPGFLLQVEGASIDKRNHAANPCEQIGETVAFDEAVRIALEFARSHPDTLVIVTADHSHTSQIVPVAQAVDERSPGTTSLLETRDGALLRVSYATNLPGHAQQHTGGEVWIGAAGPGADAVAGAHDNTELFGIMTSALGL
jgi:alkaline phosphatase